MREDGSVLSEKIVDSFEYESVARCKDMAVGSCAGPVIEKVTTETTGTLEIARVVATTAPVGVYLLRHRGICH